VHQDGPPDAPTLVLIHGLGGSTRWWDRVVPLLTASHHVIRTDLLGHGRSAKPAGGGYAIAASRASDDYLNERPLPDRLAGLGKPVLVIFGERDQRWRSSAAALYRTVPGARIEVLPGIGHSPMVEDPHRTAALLLRFTDPV
jgi:pimeloyl-ACP methyl ester carboxylesterase